MHKLLIAASLLVLAWSGTARAGEISAPREDPAVDSIETAQLRFRIQIGGGQGNQGGPANGAAQLVVQGKQSCLAGSTREGLAAWAQADAAYAGMSERRRLGVVRDIVAAQLPGIRTAIVGPDPSLRNIARVTARGRTVEMRISGVQPTPLSLPLTASLPPGSQLSAAYRTFTHFLCYEAEVMRIRAIIIGRCERIGSQIAAGVRGVLAGGQLEQSHYDALMAPFGNLGAEDRLAASWMIERIAAEPDANPRSCDMSIAATSQPVSQWQSQTSYDFHIHPGVQFLHDAIANQWGAQRCGCQ